MEDLGSVSDDQVILAWLQAEIESPPFQAYLVGDPPKPSHLARALALARNLTSATLRTMPSGAGSSHPRTVSGEVR